MKRHFWPIVLLVVVAIDIVWVAASPPPGDRFNPFFLYLAVFGIGGLLASIALAPAARGLRARVGPLAAFTILALVVSILEEVIAYVTHSGLYQDGKHALGPGLVQAGIPLFLWTLGVYVVIRLFAYSRIELYVLAGLSGWFCEAVIGQFLFKQPLLALLALPAIAFSYFVLMYLPFLAVADTLKTSRGGCLRIPGAILIPAVAWTAGGVMGALLLKKH